MALLLSCAAGCTDETPPPEYLDWDFRQDAIGTFCGHTTWFRTLAATETFVDSAALGTGEPYCVQVEQRMNPTGTLSLRVWQPLWGPDDQDPLAYCVFEGEEDIDADTLQVDISRSECLFPDYTPGMDLFSRGEERWMARSDAALIASQTENAEDGTPVFNWSVRANFDIRWHRFNPGDGEPGQVIDGSGTINHDAALVSLDETFWDGTTPYDSCPALDGCWTGNWIGSVLESDFPVVCDEQLAAYTESEVIFEVGRHGEDVFVATDSVLRLAAPRFETCETVFHNGDFLHYMKHNPAGDTLSAKRDRTGTFVGSDGTTISYCHLRFEAELARCL